MAPLRPWTRLLSSLPSFPPSVTPRRSVAVVGGWQRGVPAFNTRRGLWVGAPWVAVVRLAWPRTVLPSGSGWNPWEGEGGKVEIITPQSHTVSGLRGRPGARRQSWEVGRGPGGVRASGEALATGWCWVSTAEVLVGELCGVPRPYSVDPPLRGKRASRIGLVVAELEFVGVNRGAVNSSLDVLEFFV